MTLRSFAGASPFAHLLGIKPAAKKAEEGRREDEAAATAGASAEDDERKKRDDESDDDYAKRMKALDEKDEDKEAKRAAEEEEREKAEKEEAARSAANASRRAEDDDEDEAKTKKAEARGRLEERARGAAIFGCPAAALRPDLAAQAAFGSHMSAEEAIGFVTAAAAGEQRRPGGLASRMSAVEVPHVGTDAAAASGAPDLAAQIVAAGKKRRGEI